MERIVVRPDRRQEIGTGGVRDSGSGAIAHRRRGERTGGGEQQDPEESNRSSPEPGSVDERERGHTAGQAVERKKVGLGTGLARRSSDPNGRSGRRLSQGLPIRLSTGSCDGN